MPSRCLDSASDPYFAGVALAGADFVAAAGVELVLFLWLCFFTFAGAVVEVELAAGAGVLPVWAISAVPASNNEVIRVFIAFNSPWGFSALTPMDAAPLTQVHEKTFLNPFV